MNLYSTCRDCGGLLHITNADDTVHPLCTPKPTKVERLAQDWLDAATTGDDDIADGIEAAINEIDRRSPNMLTAALRYAQYGWPVFPLRAGQKRPASRNGFKDATTNPDRIHAWWTRHPDHNLGLPTGHTFDVIDIDPPNGVHSYLQLLDLGVIPDAHGQVTTASGGTHLYVKPTGKGNTAGTRPGIDYRGIGGYVVAPPSTLGPPGRAWTWTHRPSPLITQTGDTYGR